MKSSPPFRWKCLALSLERWLGRNGLPQSGRFSAADPDTREADAVFEISSLTAPTAWGARDHPLFQAKRASTEALESAVWSAEL